MTLIKIIEERKKLLVDAKSVVFFIVEAVSYDSVVKTDYFQFFWIKFLLLLNIITL